MSASSVSKRRQLNAASRQAKRSRRGLFAEPLEKRLLLASDVSAQWFSSLAGEYGPLAGDAANFASSPSVSPSYIVQLSDAALADMPSAADVPHLFAQLQLPVRALRGLGLAGQVLIESLPNRTDDVKAALLHSGLIESVSANGLLRGQITKPNDPQLALQTALDRANDIDIDAPEAWDIARGSRSIVIALLDSGVDYNHEDLRANIWTGTDGSHGFDFVNNDNDPLDDNGHGTNVAGILGAEANTQPPRGIAGVNWQVSIMALKHLNRDNVGTRDHAIAAINYATLMRQRGVNVQVINASWGDYGDFDQNMFNAIEAAGAAGILFVAAAGNGNSLGVGIDLDGERTPFYPASYDLDNIISVGAAAQDGSLAASSNFGPQSVDLLAPGVGIRTTGLNNTYVAERNGTSFAAPFVSGVAALILSAPGKSGTPISELKEAILSGVEKQPTLQNLSGLVATGGRLNAFGAITAQTFAPRASTAPIAARTTPGTVSFTVSYTSVAGIDESSIAGIGEEILIRREGFLGQDVRLDAVTTTALNANRVDATYEFPIADATANSFYQVIVLGNRVRDFNGLAATQRGLARFQVAINNPDVFLVDTRLDTPLSTVVNGVPRDAAGRTSLRAAIQHSNNVGGAKTILLPDGNYLLNRAGRNEENALTGDLDIRGNITILGSSQDFNLISPQQRDRVFEILAGGTLKLEGVKAGMGLEVIGGGILNAGTLTLLRSTVRDSVGSLYGGGIANLAGGITTLDQATIDSNSTTSPTSSFGGGGVYSAGLLTVRASTISNNATLAETTGGGGIFNSRGNITLVNSTISGNRAPRGKGGGIFNRGDSTINHATITNNDAVSASGVFNEEGINGPFEFERSFGRIGPSFRELRGPKGIATDAQGRVYVADTLNHRVQIFDNNGAILQSIGTRGTGPRQFDSPADVALDSAGNLFVYERGNHRIQVFNNDPQHSFRNAFAGPSGLDSNGDGIGVYGSRVYVTNRSGIFVYDFDGVLQQAITSPELTRPRDVAANDIGIYVLDFFGIVDRFALTGEYEFSFGAAEIDFADRVAIDSIGQVYVADSNDLNVKIFDGATGAFLGSRIDFAIGNVSSVAVDSAGHLFVTNSSFNTAYRFDNDGGNLVQFGFRNDNVSSRYLAVTPDGSTFVADRDDGRVLVFDSTGNPLTLGTLGTLGQFNRPQGIAVNQVTGDIYVSDTDNLRIQRFNSAGQFISTFGANKQYAGISIAANGDIYVAAVNDNRIHVFSADGVFKSAVFSEGLLEPRDVAISSDGRVYVADTGNNRIRIFLADGVGAGELSGNGTPEGLLREPSGIRFDSIGNIYIADSGNDLVRVFDSNHNPLFSFNNTFDTVGNGELSRPRSLALDATGRVYLADNRDRIQVLKPAVATNRSVSVRNSIIAGNLSATGDVNGRFTSLGNNFVGFLGLDGSGFIASGDLVGISSAPRDPRLSALADNGGSTQTHALLIGSPARNSAAVSLATDQVGNSRGAANGDGSPDIGAFERRATIVAGRVFDDTNGNSLLDAAERGHAGLTVFLDENQNDRFDAGEPTTVTSVDDPATPLINEAGKYQFFVDPGTYNVVVQSVEGFGITLGRVPSQSLPASFQVIADDSEILVDGAPIDPAFFESSPAIDSAGRIVFDAGSGQFPAPITVLAENGTFSQVFNERTNDFAIDQGRIAYSTRGLDAGVFVRESDGTVRTVVDEETAIPGNTGSFADHEFFAVDIFQDRVAFSSRGPDSQSGIYSRTTDGAVRVLVDQRTLIPGGGGIQFESLVQYVHIGIELDGNEFLFSGFHPNTGSGLYFSNGSQLFSIADNNTLIPGSSNTFDDFLGFTLKDGRVVFSGGVRINGELSHAGVFEWSLANGLRTLIAADAFVPEGDDLPFEPTSSNAIGENIVVFTGHDSTYDFNSGTGRQGIYIFANNRITKIIDTHDSINGQGIRNLSFGSDGLANNIVVFVATLDDSSDVVMTATLPYVGRRVTTAETDVETLDLNFGLQPLPGSITGNVFNDLDQDAVPDQNDPDLVGWRVFLDQNDNLQLDSGERSTSTNAEGEYTFDDLPASETYFVRLQVNSGFRRISPTNADGGRHAITLAPGELSQRRDFAVVVATGPEGVGNEGVLKGKIYEDFNNNGFNPGEGRANWTVFLDANNNGFLDANERRMRTLGDNPATANIDETGDYKFGNLPAGTHEVRTLVPSSTLLVTPLGNRLQPRDPVPTVAEPSSLALGDFDGKNGLDLVIASSQDDSLQVLLNNGAGVFTTSKTITSVGRVPSAIAVGDFDGMLRDDILTANYYLDTLSLLLNNGATTGVPFADIKKTAPGAGLPSGQTRGIAVADFDGDGKLDVATANDRATNSVFIYHYNASLTSRFEFKQAITAGASAFAIAAIHLNNDDDIDLAVANFADRTVILLRNTGDGQFVVQGSPLEVGGEPASLAVGDFNRDGKPDIAVANYRSQNVSILLGSGNFTFTAARRVSVPSGATSIVAGDIDGDGDADLIVAAGQPNAPGGITILRNRGNGTFGAAETQGVGTLSGIAKYAVAAGQIDSNDTLDMVVTNGFESTFSVLTNEVLSEGSHQVQLVSGLEEVIGLDFKVQQIKSRAPTVVDLLPVSDTGFSNIDNLTRLNNSNAANQLQFRVFGTIPGATVRLFSHNTLIGSKVAEANTTSTTIITNGTFTLVSGDRAITARQFAPGTALSNASPPLTVRVDTVLPGRPNSPDLISASDNGTSNTDNTTTLRELIFSVIAPANARVTLYRSLLGGASVAVDQRIAGANGICLFVVTGFTPGVHEMTARIVDDAGNIGAASGALRVTVVTTPSLSASPEQEASDDSSRLSAIWQLSNWHGRNSKRPPA